MQSEQKWVGRDALGGGTRAEGSLGSAPAVMFGGGATDIAGYSARLSVNLDGVSIDGTAGEHDLSKPTATLRSSVG